MSVAWAARQRPSGGKDLGTQKIARRLNSKKETRRLIARLVQAGLPSLSPEEYDALMMRDSSISVKQQRFENDSALQVESESLDFSEEEALTVVALGRELRECLPVATAVEDRVIFKLPVPGWTLHLFTEDRCGLMKIHGMPCVTPVDHVHDLCAMCEKMMPAVEAKVEEEEESGEEISLETPEGCERMSGLCAAVDEKGSMAVMMPNEAAFLGNSLRIMREDQSLALTPPVEQEAKERAWLLSVCAKYTSIPRPTGLAEPSEGAPASTGMGESGKAEEAKVGDEAEVATLRRENAKLKTERALFAKLAAQASDGTKELASLKGLINMQPLDVQLMTLNMEQGSGVGEAAVPGREEMQRRILMAQVQESLRAEAALAAALAPHPEGSAPAAAGGGNEALYQEAQRKAAEALQVQTQRLVLEQHERDTFKMRNGTSGHDAVNQLVIPEDRRKNKSMFERMLEGIEAMASQREGQRTYGYVGFGDCNEGGMRHVRMWSVEDARVFMIESGLQQQDQARTSAAAQLMLSHLNAAGDELTDKLKVDLLAGGALESGHTLQVSGGGGGIVLNSSKKVKAPTRAGVLALAQGKASPVPWMIAAAKKCRKRIEIVESNLCDETLDTREDRNVMLARQELREMHQLVYIINNDLSKFEPGPIVRQYFTWIYGIGEWIRESLPNPNSMYVAWFTRIQELMMFQLLNRQLMRTDQAAMLCASNSMNLLGHGDRGQGGGGGAAPKRATGQKAPATPNAGRAPAPAPAPKQALVQPQARKAPNMMHLFNHMTDIEERDKLMRAIRLERGKPTDQGCLFNSMTEINAHATTRKPRSARDVESAKRVQAMNQLYKWFEEGGKWKATLLKVRANGAAKRLANHPGKGKKSTGVGDRQQGSTSGQSAEDERSALRLRRQAEVQRRLEQVTGASSLGKVKARDTRSAREAAELMCPEDSDEEASSGQADATGPKCGGVKTKREGSDGTESDSSDGSLPELEEDESVSDEDKPWPPKCGGGGGMRHTSRQHKKARATVKNALLTPNGPSASHPSMSPAEVTAKARSVGAMFRGNGTTVMMTEAMREVVPPSRPGCLKSKATADSRHEIEVRVHVEVCRQSVSRKQASLPLVRLECNGRDAQRRDEPSSYVGDRDPLPKGAMVQIQGLTHDMQEVNGKLGWVMVLPSCGTHGHYIVSVYNNSQCGAAYTLEDRSEVGRQPGCSYDWIPEMTHQKRCNLVAVLEAPRMAGGRKCSSVPCNKIVRQPVHQGEPRGSGDFRSWVPKQPGARFPAHKLDMEERTGGEVEYDITTGRALCLCRGQVLDHCAPKGWPMCDQPTEYAQVPRPVDQPSPMQGVARVGSTDAELQRWLRDAAGLFWMVRTGGPDHGRPSLSEFCDGTAVDEYGQYRGELDAERIAEGVGKAEALMMAVVRTGGHHLPRQALACVGTLDRSTRAVNGWAQGLEVAPVAPFLGAPTWKCNQCLVDNVTGHNRCVACNEPRINAMATKADGTPRLREYWLNYAPMGEPDPHWHPPRVTQSREQASQQVAGGWREGLRMAMTALRDVPTQQALAIVRKGLALTDEYQVLRRQNEALRQEYVTHMLLRGRLTSSMMRVVQAFVGENGCGSVLHWGNRITQQEDVITIFGTARVQQQRDDGVRVVAFAVLGATGYVQAEMEATASTAAASRAGALPKAATVVAKEVKVVSRLVTRNEVTAVPLDKLPLRPGDEVWVPCHARGEMGYRSTYVMGEEAKYVVRTLADALPEDEATVIVNVCRFLRPSERHYSGNAVNRPSDWSKPGVDADGRITEERLEPTDGVEVQRCGVLRQSPGYENTQHRVRGYTNLLVVDGLEKDFKQTERDGQRRHMPFVLRPIAVREAMRPAMERRAEREMMAWAIEAELCLGYKPGEKLESDRVWASGTQLWKQVLELMMRALGHATLSAMAVAYAGRACVLMALQSPRNMCLRSPSVLSVWLERRFAGRGQRLQDDLLDLMREGRRGTVAESPARADWGKKLLVAPIEYDTLGPSKYSINNRARLQIVLQCQARVGAAHSEADREERRVLEAFLSVGGLLDWTWLNMFSNGVFVNGRLRGGVALVCPQARVRRMVEELRWMKHSYPSQPFTASDTCFNGERVCKVGGLGRLRLERVGKALRKEGRKVSDELGPRPESGAFIRKYDEDLFESIRRLSFRPAPVTMQQVCAAVDDPNAAVRREAAVATLIVSLQGCWGVKSWNERLRLAKRAVGLFQGWWQRRVTQVLTEVRQQFRPVLGHAVGLSQARWQRGMLAVQSEVRQRFWQGGLVQPSEVAGVQDRPQPPIREVHVSDMPFLYLREGCPAHPKRTGWRTVVVPLNVRLLEVAKSKMLSNVQAEMDAMAEVPGLRAKDYRRRMRRMARTQARELGKVSGGQEYLDFLARGPDRKLRAAVRKQFAVKAKRKRPVAPLQEGAPLKRARRLTGMSECLRAQAARDGQVHCDHTARRVGGLQPVTAALSAAASTRMELDDAQGCTVLDPKALLEGGSCGLMEATQAVSVVQAMLHNAPGVEPTPSDRSVNGHEQGAFEDHVLKLAAAHGVRVTTATTGIEQMEAGRYRQLLDGDGAWPGLQPGSKLRDEVEAVRNLTTPGNAGFVLQLITRRGNARLDAPNASDLAGMLARVQEDLRLRTQEEHPSLSCPQLSVKVFVWDSSEQADVGHRVTLACDANGWVAVDYMRQSYTAHWSRMRKCYAYLRTAAKEGGVAFAGLGGDASLGVQSGTGCPLTGRLCSDLYVLTALLQGMVGAAQLGRTLRLFVSLGWQQFVTAARTVCKALVDLHGLQELPSEAHRERTCDSQEERGRHRLRWHQMCLVHRQMMGSIPLSPAPLAFGSKWRKLWRGTQEGLREEWRGALKLRDAERTQLGSCTGAGVGVTRTVARVREVMQEHDVTSVHGGVQTLVVGGRCKTEALSAENVGGAAVLRMLQLTDLRYQGEATVSERARLSGEQCILLESEREQCAVTYKLTLGGEVYRGTMGSSSKQTVDKLATVGHSDVSELGEGMYQIMRGTYVTNLVAGIAAGTNGLNESGIACREEGAACDVCELEFDAETRDPQARVVRSCDGGVCHWSCRVPSVVQRAGQSNATCFLCGNDGVATEAKIVSAHCCGDGMQSRALGRARHVMCSGCDEVLTLKGYSDLGSRDCMGCAAAVALPLRQCEGVAPVEQLLVSVPVPSGLTGCSGYECVVSRTPCAEARWLVTLVAESHNPGSGHGPWSASTANYVTVKRLDKTARQAQPAEQLGVATARVEQGPGQAEVLTERTLLAQLPACIALSRCDAGGTASRPWQANESGMFVVSGPASGGEVQGEALRDALRGEGCTLSSVAVMSWPHMGGVSLHKFEVEGRETLLQAPPPSGTVQHGGRVHEPEEGSPNMQEADVPKWSSRVARVMQSAPPMDEEEAELELHEVVDALAAPARPQRWVSSGSSPIAKVGELTGSSWREEHVAMSPESCEAKLLGLLAEAQDGDVRAMLMASAAMSEAGYTLEEIAAMLSSTRQQQLHKLVSAELEPRAQCVAFDASSAPREVGVLEVGAGIGASYRAAAKANVLASSEDDGLQWQCVSASDTCERSRRVLSRVLPGATELHAHSSDQDPWAVCVQRVMLTTSHVPCQPFSRVNMSRVGSADSRTVDCVMAVLANALRSQSLLVVLENVPQWEGSRLLRYLTEAFELNGYRRLMQHENDLRVGGCQDSERLWVYFLHPVLVRAKGLAGLRRHLEAYTAPAAITTEQLLDGDGGAALAVPLGTGYEVRLHTVTDDAAVELAAATLVLIEVGAVWECKGGRDVMVCRLHSSKGAVPRATRGSDTLRACGAVMHRGVPMQWTPLGLWTVFGHERSLYDEVVTTGTEQLAVELVGNTSPQRVDVKVLTCCLRVLGEQRELVARHAATRFGGEHYEKALEFLGGIDSTRRRSQGARLAEGEQRDHSLGVLQVRRSPGARVAVMRLTVTLYSVCGLAPEVSALLESPAVESVLLVVPGELVPLNRELHAEVTVISMAEWHECLGTRGHAQCELRTDVLVACLSAQHGAECIALGRLLESAAGCYPMLHVSARLPSRGGAAGTGCNGGKLAQALKARYEVTLNCEPGALAANSALYLPACFHLTAVSRESKRGEFHAPVNAGPGMAVVQAMASPGVFAEKERVTLRVRQPLRGAMGRTPRTVGRSDANERIFYANATVPPLGAGVDGRVLVVDERLQQVQANDRSYSKSGNAVARCLLDSEVLNAAGCADGGVFVDRLELRVSPEQRRELLRGYYEQCGHTSMLCRWIVSANCHLFPALEPSMLSCSMLATPCANRHARGVTERDESTVLASGDFCVSGGVPGDDALLTERLVVVVERHGVPVEYVVEAMTLLTPVPLEGDRKTAGASDRDRVSFDESCNVTHELDVVQVQTSFQLGERQLEKESGRPYCDGCTRLSTGYVHALEKSEAVSAMSASAGEAGSASAAREELPGLSDEQRAVQAQLAFWYCWRVQRRWLVSEHLCQMVARRKLQALMRKMGWCPFAMCFKVSSMLYLATSADYACGGNARVHRNPHFGRPTFQTTSAVGHPFRGQGDVTPVHEDNGKSMQQPPAQRALAQQLVNGAIAETTVRPLATAPMHAIAKDPPKPPDADEGREFTVVETGGSLLESASNGEEGEASEPKEESGTSGPGAEVEASVEISVLTMRVRSEDATLYEECVALHRSTSLTSEERRAKGAELARLRVQRWRQVHGSLVEGKVRLIFDLTIVGVNEQTEDMSMVIVTGPEMPLLVPAQALVYINDQTKGFCASSVAPTYSRLCGVNVDEETLALAAMMRLENTGVSHGWSEGQLRARKQQELEEVRKGRARGEGKYHCFVTAPMGAKQSTRQYHKDMQEGNHVRRMFGPFRTVEVVENSPDFRGAEVPPSAEQTLGSGWRVAEHVFFGRTMLMPRGWVALEEIAGAGACMVRVDSMVRRMCQLSDSQPLCFSQRQAERVLQEVIGCSYELSEGYARHSKQEEEQQGGEDGQFENLYSALASATQQVLVPTTMTRHFRPRYEQKLKDDGEVVVTLRPRLYDPRDPYVTKLGVNGWCASDGQDYVDDARIYGGCWRTDEAQRAMVARYTVITASRIYWYGGFPVNQAKSTKPATHMHATGQELRTEGTISGLPECTNTPRKLDIARRKLGMMLLECGGMMLSQLTDKHLPRELSLAKALDMANEDSALCAELTAHGDVVITRERLAQLIGFFRWLCDACTGIAPLLMASWRCLYGETHDLEQDGFEAQLREEGAWWAGQAANEHAGAEKLPWKGEQRHSQIDLKEEVVLTTTAVSQLLVANWCLVALRRVGGVSREPATRSLGASDAAEHCASGFTSAPIDFSNQKKMRKLFRDNGVKMSTFNLFFGESTVKTLHSGTKELVGAAAAIKLIVEMAAAQGLDANSPLEERIRHWQEAVAAGSAEDGDDAFENGRWEGLKLRARRLFIEWYVDSASSTGACLKMYSKSGQFDHLLFEMNLHCLLFGITLRVKWCRGTHHIQMGTDGASRGYQGRLQRVSTTMTQMPAIAMGYGPGWRAHASVEHYVRSMVPDVIFVRDLSDLHSGLAGKAFAVTAHPTSAPAVFKLTYEVWLQAETTTTAVFITAHDRSVPGWKAILRNCGRKGEDMCYRVKQGDPTHPLPMVVGIRWPIDPPSHSGTAIMQHCKRLAEPGGASGAREDSPRAGKSPAATADAVEIDLDALNQGRELMRKPSAVAGRTVAVVSVAPYRAMRCEQGWGVVGKLSVTGASGEGFLCQELWLRESIVGQAPRLFGGTEAWLRLRTMGGRLQVRDGGGDDCQLVSRQSRRQGSGNLSCWLRAFFVKGRPKLLARSSDPNCVSGSLLSSRGYPYSPSDETVCLYRFVRLTWEAGADLVTGDGWCSYHRTGWGLGGGVFQTPSHAPMHIAMEEAERDAGLHNDGQTELTLEWDSAGRCPPFHVGSVVSVSAESVTASTGERGAGSGLGVIVSRLGDASLPIEAPSSELPDEGGMAEPGTGAEVWFMVALFDCGGQPVRRHLLQLRLDQVGLPTESGRQAGKGGCAVFDGALAVSLGPALRHRALPTTPSRARSVRVATRHMLTMLARKESAELSREADEVFRAGVLRLQVTRKLEAAASAVSLLVSRVKDAEAAIRVASQCSAQACSKRALAVRLTEEDERAHRVLGMGKKPAHRFCAPPGCGAVGREEVKYLSVNGVVTKAVATCSFCCGFPVETQLVKKTCSKEPAQDDADVEPNEMVAPASAGGSGRAACEVEEASASGVAGTPVVTGGKVAAAGTEEPPVTYTHTSTRTHRWFNPELLDAAIAADQQAERQYLAAAWGARAAALVAAAAANAAATVAVATAAWAAAVVVTASTAEAEESQPPQQGDRKCAGHGGVSVSMLQKVKRLAVACKQGRDAQESALLPRNDPLNTVPMSEEARALMWRLRKSKLAVQELRRMVEAELRLAQGEVARERRLQGPAAGGELERLIVAAKYPAVSLSPGVPSGKRAVTYQKDRKYQCVSCHEVGRASDMLVCEGCDSGLGTADFGRSPACCHAMHPGCLVREIKPGAHTHWNGAQAKPPTHSHATQFPVVACPDCLNFAIEGRTLDPREEQHDELRQLYHEVLLEMLEGRSAGTVTGYAWANTMVKSCCQAMPLLSRHHTHEVTVADVEELAEGVSTGMLVILLEHRRGAGWPVVSKVVSAENRRRMLLGQRALGENRFAKAFLDGFRKRTGALTKQTRALRIGELKALLADWEQRLKAAKAVHRARDAKVEGKKPSYHKLEDLVLTPVLCSSVLAHFSVAFHGFMRASEYQLLDRERVATGLRDAVLTAREMDQPMRDQVSKAAGQEQGYPTTCVSLTLDGPTKSSADAPASLALIGTTASGVNIFKYVQDHVRMLSSEGVPGSEWIVDAAGKMLTTQTLLRKVLRPSLKAIKSSGRCPMLADVDVDRMSLNCLRRGGNTHAADRGVERWQRCGHGRWSAGKDGRGSSVAMVDLYDQISLGRRLLVTARM